MPDHVGSMPPPLIPLPSPAGQNDSFDPFGSLFSDPGSSQPLFVPEKASERVKRSELPSTPSATSDFGAFVSVPASMDPLQQPLVEFDTQTALFSAHQSSPLSEFFERFTVEAKERAGQNERRVLDELLEHEDDPLYWLNSQKSPKDDTPVAGADTLMDYPSSDLTSSLRHSPEHENRPRSPQSHCPPSPPPNRYSPPPLHSTQTSTLPRKWMISTLLPSSVPSLSPVNIHDSATLSRPNVKRSTPRLTHSSPFASHVYVAPSGAPGFAGDHQWNKAGFEFEDRDRKPRGVELTGRRDSTTPVLTSHLADKLRTHLPALPRLAKSWSLLYSLDQHGVSLQTFYARCAVRVAGTLIAIQDSEDCIFGAWMSEQVRMSPGAYYGSGDSFLWKSVTQREQDYIEVFRWTGKNDYVALCEAAFISFGGGEGKYGLYLDANLIDGSSARCPTYDNPVLCATAGHDVNKTVSFECVAVESWGVAG